MRLVVARRWDGRSLPTPRAVIELSPSADGLMAIVDAKGGDDPSPDHPRGRTPRLWEHEVVELFVLGEDERYLEVELGPHGHWLALALHGSRRVVDDAVVVRPRWHDAEAGRWRASVELPVGVLPPGAARVNAYAIAGSGATRQHDVWRAPANPGSQPDFHRRDGFGALTADLVAHLRALR